MRIENIPAGSIELPFALPMFREHVLAALKKIPGVRHYALTEAQVTSLAALSASWWEQERHRQGVGASFTREQLVKFLETVVPHIPGMLQLRPSDPAKAEKIVDAFSGREPENPWVTGDLTSQQVVAKKFPELAAELKRRAKHGGSLSYAQLLEEQEAEKKAKDIRELVYDEETHRQKNVFANGANLAERSEFVRQTPEHIVAYYRDEAKRKVCVPWLENNLTGKMAIAKGAPEANGLMERTKEIQRAWGVEMTEKIKADEARIARERQAAEALTQ